MSDTTVADELDPNPELRAQYEADLAELQPRMYGYQIAKAAAIAVGGPAEEIAAIDARIASAAIRDEAILAVLAALDAVIPARRKLRDTGYPTTSTSVVSQEVYDAMQKQASDYDKALATFKPAGTASSAILTFGDPEKVPTTQP